MNIDAQGNVETAWDLGEVRLWKRIRSAKIPNKIQVFAWRACHKILTVLSSFRKQKVTQKETFLLCNQGEE